MECKLTPNALQVLEQRYLLKNEKGDIIETPEQMFRRVADNIADSRELADRICKLMCETKFLPNTPALNAGTTIKNFSACISGNTYVYTRDGLKFMNNIRVGDQVLTHAGRFKTVKRIWSNGWKETIDLTFGDAKTTHFNLSATPDHQILNNMNEWIRADIIESAKIPSLWQSEIPFPQTFSLIEFNKDTRNKELVIDNGRLKFINKIRGGFDERVNQPKAVIQNDLDMAFLFGEFLANGNYFDKSSGGSTIRFTINSEKKGKIERIVSILDDKFGLLVNPEKSNHGNWITIKVNSTFVRNFFADTIGRSGSTKRIPEWISNASHDYKMELFNGLMDDGHYNSSYKSASGKLVLANPTLVYEATLLARDLGLHAHFRADASGRLSKNPTSQMKFNDPETLMSKTVGEHTQVVNGKTFRVRGYIAREFSRYYHLVKREGQKVEVFDMEVEDDHSFVAGDLIVHNCFSLTIHDSMEDIFEKLKISALIFKSGGGVGFNANELRPKGAPVKSTSGVASGVLSFASIYNSAIEQIKAGGKRRGASILLLDISHPEIIDFIHAKDEGSTLSNFNLSVLVTDKFINAVKNNENWSLEFKGKVYKTLPAKELFDMITKHAWQVGDPGLIFESNLNKSNCHKHIGTIKNVNPCVAGDTFVSTPNGYRKASEFKVGDMIITVDGVRTLSDIEVNDNIPVFEVELSDGGVIKVTGSHQFHVINDNQYFIKRLSDIKVGEYIRVHPTVLPENKNKCNYGLSDWEYGFFVGIMLGDGVVSNGTLRYNRIKISSRRSDTRWNEILKNLLLKVGWKGSVDNDKNNDVVSYLIQYKDSVALKIVKDLGFGSDERRIPLEIMNSNPETIKGIIDGLFSTDGNVSNTGTRPIIRFSSSHRMLISDIKNCLLMFGIHCSMYPKKYKEKNYIQNREIHCHTGYQLYIMGESIKKFYELIGLTRPHKKEILEYIISTTKFGSNHGWKAKVLSIKNAGTDKVYDLHEKITDTWITEGYVSRGCGEISIFTGICPIDYPELNIKAGDEISESCNLGSFDISKYIINGEMDWDSLANDIPTAIRFLDCIPDKNDYVIPQIEKGTKLLRKIGLGIMGFADILALLGISYNSQDAIVFAEHLMEFMNYHSTKASMELAKEKGAFPAFKGSAWDTGEVWSFKNTTDRFNWTQLKEDINKHGIRNCNVNALAPTGSISIIAGCSSSLEPIIGVIFEKHISIGILYETNPIFKKLMQQRGLWTSEIEKRCSEQASIQHITEIPDDIRKLFLTSYDVPYQQHIKIQDAFQKFTDINISKSINMRNDVTEEDVRNAYLIASENCKGITVYRDGSKTEQVLVTGKKIPSPRQRFKDHIAIIREVDTGCGTFYNGLTWDNYGMLEIFPISSGKGGCTASQETTGRLGSTLLRMNTPVLAVQKQLHKPNCSSCITKKEFFENGKFIGIKSCSDGISKQMKDYYNSDIEKELIKIQKKIHNKFNGNNGHGKDNLVKDVETALIDESKKNCPECGGTNIDDTKCGTCHDCGFSKCL